MRHSAWRPWFLGLGLGLAGLLATGPAWPGRGWIIDLSTGAADLTVHGHDEEHIGHAVASGDINGDGFQDLIFRSDAAVYAIYGGTDLAPSSARPVSINLAETPAHVTIMDSDPDLEIIAGGLATGDINGDHIDDLILGLEVGPSDRTILTAHVFWGGDDLPSFVDLNSTSADLTIIAEVVGSGRGQYATSVAAGDVNGDGVDDLIVGYRGARWPEIGPGAIYVIFGGPDLSGTLDLREGAADFEVYGKVNGDWIGSTTAVGDVNDDRRSRTLRPEAAPLSHVAQCT